MEDNSTTTQPEQEMDVIEEARGLAAYKVGIGLDLYYLPVALTIGVLANIMSFIVMLMKHNRAISCCVYIAFLAVCDLGIITVTWYIYLKWTINLPPTTNSVWECKCIVWGAAFFTMNSCYFVVAMTVDRYLAICQPHRFQGLRTPRTALKVGAGVMVVFGAYTMPYLYTANFINGFCAGVATVSALSSFYSMLNVVLGSVVPFSVLIVLNGFIARAVWNRNKKVTIQTNSNSNQNADTKKGEKQLIAMLFLVSGALFVLTLPLYIRFVLAVTLDYKTSATAYANFILYYNIANKLSTTNHAVNFFLYIIGGKGFRKDVLKLLRIPQRAEVVAGVSGTTRTTGVTGTSVAPGASGATEATGATGATGATKA